ncbi:type I restriction enzyme, S subunit [Flavobacterium omnivorum]|uniref:Type I restriction enzyme, S subunit n=1 Tax=Flavobacterium omnivorum TaxID=178355 RepID=A0A1G8H4Z7_9FLAO|nr:type I restriction enzyme, S subunit [Flavobacterium omnivorum]
MRSNNIKKASIDLDDLVYVKANKVNKKQFLLKGDILITASTGSIKIIGKNAFCEENINASFGAFCKVVRAKNVHSSYLKHLFQSPQYFSYIQNVVNGSNINNIKNEHINNFKIPLPSPEIQNKIAQILDDAAALRNKTELLIKEYDVLAQSIFLDMFGDPVTNKFRFPKGTIRDLVKEAKYGTSEKAGDEGQYQYLRMNNLTYAGYMDYSSMKYVNIPDKDLHKYLVEKGDLLFNRTNSKDLVGKTSIFDSSEPMVIAGYLIRVRFNQKANPFFVRAYLNSKYGKLVLRNMCKSIVGMANINAQELQNIMILHPPIELQNQFAEKIALIEKQKELAKQELKESEDLFNCLLQKAFKGELV